MTPYFAIHPNSDIGFDIGYIRADPDSHWDFGMSGFPPPKIAFYKPAEGTKVNIAVICKFILSSTSFTVSKGLWTDREWHPWHFALCFKFDIGSF